MDMYGNRVSFGKATVQAAPVRAINIGALELGPIGCHACHSGDFPGFDFEQQILRNF